MFRTMFRPSSRPAAYASSTVRMAATTRSTTASVRASGVPCESSKRASMMSPSVLGKILNLRMPPAITATDARNRPATTPTVR